MFTPDLEVKPLEDDYCVHFVGWLDNTHPFTTGEVSSEFFKVLQRHIEEAWQPVLFAGWHDCELCTANPYASSFLLFIPAGKILYFAPISIDHYITEHQYQPPQPFVDAVVASPQQVTPAYFDAIEPFARRWSLIGSAGLKRYCMRRRVSKGR
jgi:hypothetical protein